MTMLWFAVSKMDFEYIEQKFLLTGHTFNEGDSVHSAIEKASSNVDVYTPTHWGMVIRSASHRRQYIVKEIMTEDFFDFKDLSKNLLNFEVDTEGNKVSWLKIRSIKIKKCNPNVAEIKYGVDSPPVTLNLFQKGRRSMDFPDINNLQLKPLQPLKIDSDKHRHLMKMCEKKIIPRAHHDYYENIPHL